MVKHEKSFADEKYEEVKFPKVTITGHILMMKTPCQYNSKNVLSVFFLLQGYVR